MTEMNNGPETLKGEDWAGEMGAKWLANLACFEGMIAPIGEALLKQADFKPGELVLDIGCGEAPWRKPLLKLRPGLHYQGVDASEYVVRRYGRSRNIALAGFGQMQQLRIGPPADLLVCADVLHYVPGTELKRGLEGFPELCSGVAYIDVFCREDAITGDFKGFIARGRAQYRKLFDSIGLTALGSHCYLSPACDSPVSALERL